MKNSIESDKARGSKVENTGEKTQGTVLCAELF